MARPRAIVGMPIHSEDNFVIAPPANRRISAIGSRSMSDAIQWTALAARRAWASKASFLGVIEFGGVTLDARDGN